MPRPTKRQGATGLRKAKKTFVLSRESIKFLEAERKKRGTESASAVLEQIIHESRCKTDTSKIDAAISAYYDSVSEEERKEDWRCGKFAESQFPLD
jgi:hypothetical protein